MPIFIQINDIDNVAVALHPAPAGTAFGSAAAVEEIPQGHKMALKDIAKGDMIMKPSGTPPRISKPASGFTPTT